MEVGDHEVYSYGQFDLYHDSRYAGLNRHDATVGSRVYLFRGTSIDPFFTRSIDTHRTPRLGYTLGAVLRTAL